MACKPTATRLATARHVFETVTPLVPTSRREFGRTETIGVFARVYQGGTTALASVATRVSVMDTAAKTIFAGNATLPAGEFGESRSTELKVDVPLQRLPPGEYLLTLEAALGKSGARRDVRFTVR